MLCKYCLIPSKSITITENSLIVQYPNVSVLNNKDCLVFKILQEIPTTNSELKVYFCINNHLFAMLNSNGNSVRANQLKLNKLISARISTENLIMIIKCYLAPTGIEYPAISA